MHIIGEGKPQYSGLNITVSHTLKRPWIAFSYITIDLGSYQATRYYFRIRTNFWPFFIWSKQSWNIVDNYLLMRGKKVITYEQYSDLLTSRQGREILK